jgi:hypothetical protein
MVGATSAYPGLQAQLSALEAAQCDPFIPIPVGAGRPAGTVGGTRQIQRLRRSEILATIRRLLAESGCDNVTVRKIAGVSGYAVQTIYNLVGPRNDAISEAISEYSIFVGRTAIAKPEDPTALPSIVNGWLHAVSIKPELARQANLIYFTDARDIYYKFRDRQLIGMRKLLMKQKNCGIIKQDVDISRLAEHLVFCSSSLWLEWSDRPFPLELLHERLCSGYAALLSDKLDPQYGGVIADWLSTISRPGGWRASPIHA